MQPGPAKLCEAMPRFLRGCHSKAAYAGPKTPHNRTVGFIWHLLLQVGLLAGVIFVRAKQLEVPVPPSTPKADKPEDTRPLKSVSPK